MRHSTSRNDPDFAQTHLTALERVSRPLALLVPALLGLILALGFPRAPSSALQHLLLVSALSEHASPAIRSSDALWVARRFPELASVAAPLAEELAHGGDAPSGLVRRSPGGAYFSEQFWLYALLAAPWVRASALLSANPALGFAAFNWCVLLLVNAYLGRALATPRERFQARMLFLLCGTSFYLGWADPVLLIAGAALVATLAATRAELGVGIAAAGVAAAMSPSAIVLVLFVAAWWLRLRWSPGVSISGPTAKPSLSLFDALGVSVGLGLTALPYLFFRHHFGVSNLAAKYTIDPRLLSAGRFESFFFDLSQGMVVGVPGLMLALSVATYAALFGSARSERSELLRGLFFTDLALTFLVMPALGVRDWNSESSVFLRGAYWRAMPLLGSLLALLPRLPLGFERATAGVCVAAQLAVIGLNGPTGADSNHLRHTPLAQFALQHFPWAYDPVPEIFRERTLGREDPPRHASLAPDPVVWPLDGRPRKILAHLGSAPIVPRLCGPRRAVTSSSVTRVPPDERYLNAPFRCAEP